MTINEFAVKFKSIKRKGFVPSMRKGPTGIGYTLETLLNIDENNFSHPDIEGAELKAHRTGFRTYEDKLPLLFQNIQDL